MVRLPAVCMRGLQAYASKMGSAPKGSLKAINVLCLYHKNVASTGPLYMSSDFRFMLAWNN